MRKIGTIFQVRAKNYPHAAALYLGENGGLAADVRFAKRYHASAKVLDAVHADAIRKYERVLRVDQNGKKIEMRVEPIVLWED